MSTNWGYQCRTCDTRSGSIFNHGQDILRSLAKTALHIKAALNVDASGYLEISILNDHVGAVSFLCEHADHDLELISEYGDIETLVKDPTVLFERQLQIYERAVAQYQIAQNALISALGVTKAEPILEQAGNRVCRVVSPRSRKIILSYEQVESRALMATPIVDTSLEGTDA